MSVLCGTIKEKSEIELPRRKVSYFSLLTDFPLITEAGVSIQTKTKERKGMYREFIDEFVLSPSMREYLKTVDLSVEQITQLIYFSPVLLQQKKQAFYRLRDLADRKSVV